MTDAEMLRHLNAPTDVIDVVFLALGVNRRRTPASPNERAIIFLLRELRYANNRLRLIEESSPERTVAVFLALGPRRGRRND